MVAQRLLREDLVIRAPHKESKGERLYNTVIVIDLLHSIFQEYESINSLEFFFFILMNYVKDLCILHSFHFFKIVAF